MSDSGMRASSIAPNIPRSSSPVKQTVHSARAMFFRFWFLLALILVGATAAALLSRRLERIEADRLARYYLVAVALLMGVRMAAYVAANVFGIRDLRPPSTGPFDPTNLLIGGLYGIALLHARRGGFDAFLRRPEVLLALRVATGVAFVLAGLSNVFRPNAADFFIQMGYTETFHRFIMTAEVLGGVALLLPWRWLTLIAVAGLMIDMFGALYTLAQVGQPFEAAALAMLFRLAPLAALSLDRRWTAFSIGTVACAIIAVAGSVMLRHPS